MKRTQKLLIAIVSLAGILALIFDSQTALIGASEGIDLCIRTVIPSLFPFFILSIILTTVISNTRIPLLKPLCRLCKLPEGSESILLIGILGGYPIGAQCISNAYVSGQLSKENAQRMLGFCNNAGPAFLFGMVGPLFETKTAAILLWLIHIISAIATGFLLPKARSEAIVEVKPLPISLGRVMQKSIFAMANVCGWVIVFRVILGFMRRWFLWLLPSSLQVLLCGIFELSNGCIELYALDSCTLKFIYAVVFLGLGGLCVLMQTLSAVSQAGLDLGMYIPGKILQTAFSCILAVPTSNTLFSSEKAIPYSVIVLPLIIIGIAVIFLKNKENNSSIPALSDV